MKKYLYLIVAAVAVLFAACRPYDDSELKKIEELAVTQSEIIVNDGGGLVSFDVYAGGAVTLDVENGCPQWLEMDATSLPGDGPVKLFLQPNGSWLRMAVINVRLSGTSRVLQVAVKQKGVEQYLEAASPFSVMDGRTDGTVNFIVSTNVPAESMAKSISYMGLDRDWISSVDIAGNNVLVRAKANPSDLCRRASCDISFVNGWGETISARLFITQTNRDGQAGKALSIARLKALASETGTKIEDDYQLEGIVVSDCSSANMDLNPAKDFETVDTDYSLRTAYVEGTDGSWGLRLQFTSKEENQLIFGSKVTLGLYDATILREVSPDRYTLKDLTRWNIMSTVTGATVPNKQKTISQLTDDDIYTYVSLKNTEFAFKEGTYADVYEVYSEKLDGWASLLVDSDGKGIYAPVNMACPWRRTGSGVPKGSGLTKGIIVHHDMPRMGNVGRYQIRVVDESGFAQGNSGSVLKDFAYFINSYNNRNKYAEKNAKYSYNKLATVIPSNDILTSGASTANAELRSENTVVPVSRPNDPYTTANYYVNLVPDNDGVSKTLVGIGDITTTHDWYRWNASTQQCTGYNGFTFDFSTQNISASSLTFSFDFAGGYITAGVARGWPAHWCVEYSLNDGASYTIVNNCVTGEPYVHMRGLPFAKAFLNGQWYFTPEQAGMGFTQHHFVLPADVLGKEKVRIRLRPYDKKIVSLPLVWTDDIEQSEIDYTTDIDIRVRFGFFYIRYR
ncbi:MAG: BACON domain-containing protein [Bacteroidales bacterium]|nr:BACON domain-containing protein [Bacteroidales bacterium]MBQ9597516.1 BACON domain-containing protein [Bacteroidales bacterium]